MFSFRFLNKTMSASLVMALVLGSVLSDVRPASAQAVGTVSLSASRTSMTINDTFTVTVTLANAPSFASWNTFLRFDPQKVELTTQAGATSGQFASFVPDVRPLTDADPAKSINGSGEVHAGGINFTNANSGNGTMGVFTFRAKAAGATTITTQSTSSSNLYGNALFLSTDAENPIVPGVGTGTLNLTITDPVATQPDLIVETVTVTPPATGATAYTVNARVKNIGTASAGNTGTRLHFDTNNDGTRDITVAGITFPRSTATSTIPAGAFDDEVFALTPVAPSTFPTGTHKVEVCADDIAPGITEADETNNCRSQTFTISPPVVNQPDLVTTSLAASVATPTAGQVVTFSGLVRNQGQADAAASQAAFCVDNTNCPTGAKLGNTLNVGALTTLQNSAPLESSNWTAVAGTHVIHFCADATSLVTESAETNNCTNISLTVQGGTTGSADLVPQGLSKDPATPETGTAVTFSAFVGNIGSVASAASELIFCIDDANCGQAGASELSRQPVPAIAPLGVSARLGSSTWTTTVGSHVAYVCVVDTANPSNNCGENSFTVQDPLPVNPTVSLNVPTVQYTARPGDTITIPFTITVRGLNAAQLLLRLTSTIFTSVFN